MHIFNYNFVNFFIFKYQLIILYNGNISILLINEFERNN